ncbi:MAG: hypothetical protein CEE38_11350 [Planctomycetes bacterium B3_Pla]|nr:MAG: hypothetical protein CEE38_11350 [Planctomycetes bacterium B3_Pla]
MYKKVMYLFSAVLLLSMTGAAWAGVTKPNPADGATYEDTWANLSWTAGSGAASFDVYFGDNFNDVKDGAGDAFRGNQASPFLVVGFVGFPFPDGLVPGTTYYWRIDEIQTDGTTHTGGIWSFSIPSKTATDPDPADGAEFVDPNTVTLRWSPGFGAKLHTVYFGDNYDEVNNATGGSPQGTMTYSPGTLELEKVYYWRVDEFDVVATFKGEVWSFTTPGAVGNPDPANGAVDVQMTATLTWTPADSAASHQVYFGTDAEAVNNATTDSPEYQGSKALGSETLDPGKLVWDTDYYWRVDAVYDADPANPVKGLVWGLTTADFILVDGFETYNDLNPDEEGSNRIFDKWIDGFGTTTNGALIGNDMPPYAEQTFVRTGAQSMPYFYDNNDLKYSEATLTLVSPRDWTENDVNNLTLYFMGNSQNAAEQMYVALNGSAAVYHDNPDALKISIWTAWNIELKEFADQGVDLTNVDTISIGFGDKDNLQDGGSGKMIFDDIRLAAGAAPVGKSLLFQEDFESVVLGPSIEESAGTQDVWTDTPPDGWIVDESGVPGIGDLATDGVTEWAGWAFADKQFWINTDQQRRAEFELGQGVVAVSDCDEWDDAAHPDSAASGWYKTFMSTLPIDISSAQEGTVQLTFDSSWRPEFDSDYHQTGNITASFDGSEPVEVLLWESDPGSPNFKNDQSTNETITVDLENPPWATSVVLTFGMYDAGNDWWWAVDNIKVTGFPK